MKIQPNNDETELKRARLRYRSTHRGIKEMDVLLTDFTDVWLAQFTPQQLDEYDALLNEQDQDLYHYIIGRDVPPDEIMSSVMKLFLAHKIAK